MHGVALTRHFYARMFEHNPSSSTSSTRDTRPAASNSRRWPAPAAYAEQIDDPSVLAPVVTRIEHKHVSLGVRPSITPSSASICWRRSEVLGEAATDELVDAWAAAYGQWRTC